MTPVTYLFVPATRTERIAKAFAAGAQGVRVDLEDAIDASEKIDARARLDVFLTASVHPVWVRTNAVTTQWFEDDLALIKKHSQKVAGVMLAKTESPFEVDVVDAGAEGTAVIALVESAAGMLALERICAHPRVIRIAFGSADLSRDLGCEDTWETLQHARSQVVLHSAAADLLSPIDGVTFALDQPDVVEHDAALAARHGFGAKLCIHPSQIKPALQGFMPTAQQLQWAQEILDAGASGSGAQRLRGQMIDRPVIERARQILQRHESFQATLS